ncbi:SDR family oxidoreductase [Halorarius halobius]|uniref:SDR family oxidoreductase n=1 Tax=Halorarius halobius TaxID=2962671 RepID=UPI0020CD942C|nr:SDR family oxidoreductase [Halorarius halobius]
MDSLEGQSAVVTGASSGIGAATARALAREGANVAVAARRSGRLQELAGELEGEFGVEAAVVPTDVTDREAVDALVETTVERFGGLDLLVSNAGVAAGRDVVGMSDDEYGRMMAVNCDGTFYATRAALPHLRDSEGTLVYVGSYAGRHPRAYNPVYAATKWWTRGFAKSVSAGVGDEVAVSVVNPAAVRTEFEVDGEQFRDRFDPGEVVEPEEVADAVAFAAAQSPSMVHEIDLYERSKLAKES